MSNFLVNDAGELIAVQKAEKVLIEDAQKIVTELEAKLETVRTWLASKGASTGQAAPAAPVVPPVPPADPVPADNADVVPPVAPENDPTLAEDSAAGGVENPAPVQEQLPAATPPVPEQPIVNS